MIVVMVLRLVLEDIDVCEPLDHPAADVAWDDHANREAVIWLQPFAIVLVRNEDVVRGIHGANQGGAGLILDELAPRLVLGWTRSNLVGQVLVSDEFNVLACYVPVADAHGQEEVAEGYALPHVGGNAAGSPVEADGLTDHVICSLRRLPAHTSVTGSSREVMETIYSIPRLSFWGTMPPTLTRCSSHLRSRNAP